MVILCCFSLDATGVRMADFSASPFTGNVVSIDGAQRESRIFRLRYDFEACILKSRKLREAPEMTALLDFCVAPVKSLLQEDFFTEFLEDRVAQFTQNGKPQLGKSTECTCLRKRKKSKSLGSTEIPRELIHSLIIPDNEKLTALIHDVGRIQAAPGTGCLAANELDTLVMQPLFQKRTLEPYYADSYGKTPSTGMTELQSSYSDPKEDITRIRIVRVESLSACGMNGACRHVDSKSPGVIATSTIHNDAHLPPQSLYSAVGGADGNSIGSASATQYPINKSTTSSFSPPFYGVNKTASVYGSMPPLLQRLPTPTKREWLGACFYQQAAPFNSMMASHNGEVFPFHMGDMQQKPITIYSPTLSPGPRKGRTPCIHMTPTGNSKGLGKTKFDETLPFGSVCGQDDKLCIRRMLPLAKKPRCEASAVVRRISVSGQ